MLKYLFRIMREENIIVGVSNIIYLRHIIYQMYTSVTNEKKRGEGNQ